MRVIILLLILFLFTAPSKAETKSIKIQSDNRLMILFEEFGFTDTSNITVAFSSKARVNSPVFRPYPSSLGFFVSADMLVQIVRLELQQTPDFCVLDPKFISPLFTFLDLSPPPLFSFRGSYPVTYDEHSFFFDKCNPGSILAVDIRTERFNSDGGGPFLYYICLLIYLYFLWFWFSMCFKNTRYVHDGHLLMGGLLIIKTFSLFCAAEVIHYVKVTGTRHGWNALFDTFRFLDFVLWLTELVFNCAVLRYLKPPWRENERKVFMMVILLPVLTYLAFRAFGEMFWFATNIISYCVIIFPVALSFSQIDEKAARNSKAFRLICILVIGYFWFTKIGVSSLMLIETYKYQWVCSAAMEIASLVLFLLTFYMCRPVEKNGYFVFRRRR